MLNKLAITKQLETRLGRNLTADEKERLDIELSKRVIDALEESFRDAERLREKKEREGKNASFWKLRNLKKASMGK